MILTPHILVGATIGAKIHNFWLIIILSMVSHFILDKIFHWEYSSNNKFFKKFRETGNLKSLFVFTGQTLIDAFIGLTIVFVFLKTKNLLLNFTLIKNILIGCFFSVVPDIVLGISLLFRNSDFSQKYHTFHNKYLHFEKKLEKEGAITFLGIFTQIVIMIISLLLLFFS
ncbi:MAG TPA: hypothetical protein PK234_00115 [Candidatus Portnoybacteria bacterium]|jgi:hypothetical protein|nr:hypothetical protein [Candidatus Portnoybacteria bacterium]MDD5751989.1 hypothetical protein [Candidatus Portnoybacteria bacterium]HNU96627.1 hypothetical protein [Candidatus Portnoybacteria bacterium]HOZ16207.1 hypothetical protein [Candidatus Portnoybacteria bacterium]HPH51998.1 hypothetical protein [Candidatus Portnoybacteria bacterium]